MKVLNEAISHFLILFSWSRMKTSGSSIGFGATNLGNVGKNWEFSPLIFHHNVKKWESCYCCFILFTKICWLGKKPVGNVRTKYSILLKKITQFSSCSTQFHINVQVLLLQQSVFHKCWTVYCLKQWRQWNESEVENLMSWNKCSNLLCKTAHIHV